MPTKDFNKNIVESLLCKKSSVYLVQLSVNLNLQFYVGKNYKIFCFFI